MAERVKSLESAINLVEAIAFSDQPLGISALARQLGLAKSAVSKHLGTLAERGYVVQERPGGGYSIGPRFALMARFVSPCNDLPSLAAPLMAEVRDALGLSVVLSLPDRDGARVARTVRNHALVEIGVRDGSLLPLHTSAQGKVVAAWFLPALPPDTPIGSELAQVRARGYATAPDQVLQGINTVSVPVFSPDGKLAAAVGVVGSTAQLTGALAEQTRQLLQEQSKRLSRMIYAPG